ncbi:MAG: hypothetical protein V4608_10925 [Bacteroidota bacterium]
MAEANKPVPKAKVTVFGKVRLSVAPADPENPIAVGDNDPRLGGSSLPTGSEVVTALAGGQAGAFQSSKKRVRIDLAASAGYGVKCSDAILNSEQHFNNRIFPANNVNIYPKSGERFLSEVTLMAVDAPILVASRNNLSVYCYEAGIWTTI